MINAHTHSDTSNVIDTLPQHTRAHSMWQHTHAISRAATAAAATQTHHASRGAVAHLRTATLAVPSVAATPAVRSLSSLACCVAISSSGSGRRGPCLAPVRAFGSSAKSSGSGSSDMLPIVTIEGESCARNKRMGGDA